MSIEKAPIARPARVIIVGNEKGGSGKSTVAMHIAMALIKSGQSVATIDLDSRQRSFNHYIENRRAWAQHVGRDLEIPNHTCYQQQYAHRMDRRRRCRIYACPQLDRPRRSALCGFRFRDHHGRFSSDWFCWELFQHFPARCDDRSCRAELEVVRSLTA